MSKGNPSEHCAVTDYWIEYYTGKTLDEDCTLCGNHGIIDTTGVRTPNGNLVGRKNYCICPNGQAMRKSNTKDNTTI